MTTDKQKGQSLTAGNLQELLDSATNADQIGGQQFYTPPEYAKAFAIALNPIPGVAIDFEMGAGNLLSALESDPKRTIAKLGVDIDERVRKPAGAEGNWQTMRGDVTRLYPLWHDVEMFADTVAINPPFSLRWHSDRLMDLTRSRLPAVARAAAEALRKPTIDSTLASLLIALDRLSHRGEGFMVCNENTAKRFLGDPDLGINAQGTSIPTAALRRHVWLWLTVPGSFFDNVLTEMPVAVLYFASGHQSEQPLHLTAADTSLVSIRNCLSMAALQRDTLRRGMKVFYEGDAARGSTSAFEAAKGEYACLYGERARPYNIWLDENGCIQRHLTNYQRSSRKVDSTQVSRLNAIAGQRPMAMVVQKATRTALLSVVRSDIWKVEPSLLAKVEESIAEYNSVRAPFYPLNDVQRLGYLDEEDSISCRTPLGTGFIPGKIYPIATSTRKVTRKGSKLSLLGERQELELTGMELFITITDGSGAAHEFTHLCEVKDEYHHDLECLIQHFVIPQVPDIAALKPDQFERNLQRLEELEGLINQNRRRKQPAPPPEGGAGAFPAITSSAQGPDYALRQSVASTIHRSEQEFRFRKYQRDDLARSTLHDGLVFAWDTGLGKTAAIFGWSWLLHPDCRAVLIVAPGGLHDQIIADAQDLFGIEVKRLYSQDDFRRDPMLQAIHLAQVNGAPHPLSKAHRPCYWITSYIDLGFSGADEWTPKEDEDGELIIGHRLERDREKIPGWMPQHHRGIGEENPQGIRCVHKPSLATLVRHLFDAVAIDEAVAIKSTDSYRSLGVRRLNPRFRLVLTATPVKNHLDDIFWLVQWATGGNSEPTARWPYENTAAAKERFANEHMVIERNITAEQKALSTGGRFRSVKKRIPALCNVHHLWKLLGPCIVRRRKSDTQEEMVAKKIVPIRIPPGTAQQEVYRYHLFNPPLVNKKGETMSEMSQVAAQLQVLRQAALCPDSENMRSANGQPHKSARSWSDFNPKAAAILKLIHDLISQGEQVVIMSPFQHFSTSIFNRLREAGVSVCLLDGNMPPLKRGKIAAQFKQKRYAVLIGGIDSMGAGYSFENAAHLILPSLSWAFDSNEQAINRVHRLNSPREVTIYTMVIENTIDEKLADIFHEKGDCSSLALDGQLFSDDKKEINLFELLREAVRNFNPEAETVSELAVEQEWRALRARLTVAEQAFRQWHPPILRSNPVTKQSVSVSAKALTVELLAMTSAVAEVEARDTADAKPSNAVHRAIQGLRDL